MDWARARARVPKAQTPVAGMLQRITGGLIDWESAITLVLVLGAVTAVSVPLEDGGWRENMPALTSVAVIAVICGMLLARSRVSMFLAWPLGIVIGAAVVFWQMLSMVGPGTFAQRLDAIYFRFEAWFNLVGTDGVSQDPLPFNVLVLSLTWLGVLLFTWSVFRWHNAWIGLIPGGTILFLDLTLVGDDLTGTIILYMLFGLLLVMQTHLLSSIRRWRSEGTSYPAMLNLTFLNFSLWTLVGLVTFAWVMPAGLSTPGPVQTVVDESLRFGAKFVRLAGPLQSNKVIPIHSYSGVLPFQGSIKLGDRELMSVTITDRHIDGEMLLRGTVYENYGGGGWTTGDRSKVDLPEGRESGLRDGIEDEEIAGDLIPIHIEMEAKTVVGTVIFSPGTPVSVTRDLSVEVPDSAVITRGANVENFGVGMTDEEVFAEVLAEDEVGVSVNRSAEGGVVTSVSVVKLDGFGLVGDTAELDPGERIKRHRSYFVTGFIPTWTEEELRNASTDYSPAIFDQYTNLPDTVPDRVRALATDLTADADNPYDKAQAIENYLRQFPLDFNVEETPPDRDTVDYFLFDLRRGYFDYHASAMVVMLREIGIPSRLAVGFVTSDDVRDRDPDTGAYIVRDENSFAWPEVYFPDYGWVAFQPTSGYDEIIRPTVHEEPVLEEGTFDSLLDQIPLPQGGLIFPGEGDDITFNGSGSEGSAPVGTGSGEPASTWAVLAVVAFVAALAGVVYTGWQRSVSGLPYPEQVWEKMVRMASWGGNPPRPGQTPHDYARALRRRYHIRDMVDLADAYSRSRYGHRTTDIAQTAQISKVWPEVRGALVRDIFGRIFRRRR